MQPKSKTLPQVQFLSRFTDSVWVFKGASEVYIVKGQRALIEFFRKYNTAISSLSQDMIRELLDNRMNLPKDGEFIASTEVPAA